MKANLKVLFNFKTNDHNCLPGCLPATRKSNQANKLQKPEQKRNEKKGINVFRVFFVVWWKLEKNFLLKNVPNFQGKRREKESEKGATQKHFNFLWRNLISNGFLAVKSRAGKHSSTELFANECDTQHGNSCNVIEMSSKKSAELVPIGTN